MFASPAASEGQTQTYPKHHCALDDPCNRHCRSLKSLFNIRRYSDIGRQKIYVSSESVDLLYHGPRSVICIAATCHHSEVFDPSLSKIDSQGATETTKTADNKVATVFTEVESLGGSSDLSEAPS